MRGLKHLLRAVWNGTDQTDQRAGSPENPSTNLAEPAEWLTQWANGGSMSTAGVSVSTTSAMRQSAVFACVRNIAEDVAALPLHVFGAKRQKLTSDPRYRLLHSEPNPLQSSFDWLMMQAVHVQLWGNGYSEIELAGDGITPVGLWPIPPWLCKPVLLDRGTRVVYRVNLPQGGVAEIPADRMLHVPGLAFDGVEGKSVISYARDTVGRAIAADTYGAAFFRNSARPSGTLQLPPTVDPKKGPDVLKLFNQSNAGLDNVARTALLTMGATWNKTGFTNEEAQFLDTMKFSAIDIARFWRMPPAMIGNVEQRFANNEQQALQYVVHCLTPWLVRFERQFNRRLFAGEDVYAKFMVMGLLRGDSAARGKFYATGRQWGWLCADDIREWEEQEPLPNDAGQTFLQPINMTDAEDPATDPAVSGKVDENPGTQSTTN